MRTHRYGAVFLAIFLAACGSDKGGGVAQPNSTIQINPSAIGHSYSGDVIQRDPGTGRIITAFEDPVTVTILNENGNPLKNTQVRMFHLGDFTLATYPDKVLQTEPYITNTDDFGNVSFYLYTPTFDTVGDTETDFEVFSGSAYANMTVTLTCTDINTATTNICD